MMLTSAAGLALAGCTVEKISPPGIVLTRPIAVKPRNVQVFQDVAQVPRPHSVVEKIWIKDDGALYPDEMLSQLRVKAGAIGANAIVLDPTNRRDNGTRIDLKLRFDNPFDYFSGTAIWIGPGERPETYLVTIGGVRRPSE